MTRARSRTEGEIPLHLLPLAVARKVREWGDVVYRISIVRTHWHHYNVTVRTRLIHKELAPEKVASISRDAPAESKRRSRSGRQECAA